MSSNNATMPPSLEGFVVGETSRLIGFANRADNRELACAMAKQAQRSIDILTPDLEGPVFDSAPFLEAVKQLAMRSRFSRIRVIIRDAGHLMKHGHRMVELARRLSSSIQMHRPGPQDGEFDEGFLVVDDAAFIRKTVAARYAGLANFNDRLQASKLLQQFDELWEHSQPDEELRRLHL